MFVVAVVAAVVAAVAVFIGGGGGGFGGLLTDQDVFSLFSDYSANRAEVAPF